MCRLRLPLIAALMLAAAFPASAVRAATKVVMLYNATSAYSASYVAQDEGYFAKHGLDFEFSLTSNTTMTPAALMSETVQLGGITPPMILQANEQGLDLVVVAGGTAAPDPAGTSGMLARTGSGIKTAQDMIDHKVGVPGLGGTFDILAKKWVESKGVDFRKVTWIEVPFTRMGDTMKAGLVDVVAATLPFYARIVDGKIGYDMGDLFTGVPDGSLLAFYGASRDWARKNPEAVKGFLKALNHGIKDAIADPQAALDAVVKREPLVKPTLGCSSVHDPRSRVELELEWAADLEAIQAFGDVPSDADLDGQRRLAPDEVDERGL